MQKAIFPKHERTIVDTKAWAIPSSNCVAHCILAELSRLYVAGVVWVTRATISIEVVITCEAQ